MGFLALTFFVGWQLRPRTAPQPDPSATRRDLTVVLLALLGQAAIGYTQYFSGVPAALVLLHVTGATVLWISLVRFYLRRTRLRVAFPLAAADTRAHGTEPEPSRRR